LRKIVYNTEKESNKFIKNITINLHEYLWGNLEAWIFNLPTLLKGLILAVKGIHFVLYLFMAYINECILNYIHKFTIHKIFKGLYI
jgi:hypothetical protein